MNQEAMVTQLYAAWTIVRHVAFWAKWAFYVLFAWPSVALCAALALYSGFSFSTIPRELYQYAADATKQPAAPDGYLTVQTCKDPKPDTSSVKIEAPVMCKNLGFVQEPIDALAKEAGRYLWLAYAVVVFIGAFLASMFGLFESSRRAFKASIISVKGEE